VKLYYAPGACSIGIHILLEETGKTYDLELAPLTVPVPDRPLTEVNVKSKVPTLIRADGSVLTEFGAIATWIARTSPEAHLIPADPDQEVRCIEAMDYCVGTIHMHGFSRLFRPSNYTPHEADYDTVKARGREMVDKGFALMDKALEGKDYVAGAFSIADAALFYVEFWAAARMKIALPPNCVAHYERMKTRPAVAAVLTQEGFA
jgi:glutathione S-transferase